MQTWHRPNQWQGSWVLCMPPWSTLEIIFHTACPTGCVHTEKSPFFPSLTSYLSRAHFDSCVSHAKLDRRCQSQNLRVMLVPDIGFCLLIIDKTIISLLSCLQYQIVILPQAFFLYCLQTANSLSLGESHPQEAFLPNLCISYSIPLELGPKFLFWNLGFSLLGYPLSWKPETYRITEFLSY